MSHVHQSILWPIPQQYLHHVQADEKVHLHNQKCCQQLLEDRIFLQEQQTFRNRGLNSLDYQLFQDKSLWFGHLSVFRNSQVPDSQKIGLQFPGF